jgi:hypothetical protein
MTRRMSKQHLALAIKLEAFDPHTNPLSRLNLGGVCNASQTRTRFYPPLLLLAAAALTQSFVHLTILLVGGMLSLPSSRTFI